MRVFAPVLAAMLAASSAAAELSLVMIEQPGCAWCARWREEIGVAYPRTDEGRRAPLRPVSLAEPWPEDLAQVRPERFTPTFVLVEDGVEVGRLRGYAGSDFFWHLLGELLDAADAAAD